MWETGKVHKWFRRGDLMERGHLEDQGIEGKTILKWIFKKLNGKARTGLLWPRIGTDSGQL